MKSIFSRITLSALVSVVIFGASGSAFADFTQGFDTVTPAGWTVTNHSSLVGSTSWFQGNNAVFNAQAGAVNSYAGANFNNTRNTTGATSTISDWLITPTVTVNNGDVFSFFTRTIGTPAFADRLQLRFSDVGGTNVGTTATDVGDFTTLLKDINSQLTVTGYPADWTQFTITLSGLSGSTNGAFAFRYFVTNGGPSGANSDYIGVDTVSFTSSQVPEPTSIALLGLGMLGLVAVRRRKAKQTA